MNVLITSGGGAKGAFSVGALKHFRDGLGINAFDFISGTSTGALIAAMMAAGKLETLIDVYLNTVNDGILKPENLINNITQGKPYLYGTEPLLRQIETHLTEQDFNRIMQSECTLCLNAVCLQTGKLTVFSTKNLAGNVIYDCIKINSYDDMKKALLASTNQPVFMDPVEYNGNQYVDGGTREVIPSRIVVDNLPPGKKHKIYIVSNNPDKVDEKPGEKFTSIIDVLARTIDVFIEEVRLNDIQCLTEFTSHSNGNVTAWMILPDRQLDTKFSTGLNFDPLEMSGWMLEGEVMAGEVFSHHPDGYIPFV